MKNKLNILIFVAIGILFFTSCKKNPDLPMPELTETVTPKLIMDVTLDQTINAFDLTAFEGGVTVDLLFPNGAKPESIDIMVAFNGNTRQTGVLFSGITAYPTAKTFGINELAAAVGENVVDLVGGNYFRVFTIVNLTNGTKVNGLDTLYAGFNPATALLPTSSLRVDFNVVCPLDIARVVGTYAVREVPSRIYPTTNYTSTIIADAGVTNGIIINDLWMAPSHMHAVINPTTYRITAAAQIITDWVYMSSGVSYGRVGIDSFTGSANTCDDILTFSLRPTLPETGYIFGPTNAYTMTRTGGL